MHDVPQWLTFFDRVMLERRLPSDSMMATNVLLSGPLPLTPSSLQANTFDFYLSEVPKISDHRFTLVKSNVRMESAPTFF